ncbi:GL23639 [Drosophila persimilis]|uniref:GL23639 n=1 Tax=Drosophila persimilis TaxID=7234 RepID=B4G2B8_DROPE|nr:GL23639 [Drosophila persimilis]
MSNDVQIASDAKIGTEVHRRNDKQQPQHQREVTGISKTAAGSVVGEDIEYVFGSISPRGGCTNAKHLVGSCEPESPEHTPRDTTESDINISSCSTLDIVNKVSDST